MPRRSNLFQRIVHALYDALKPSGGTVTESAQLHESTSGILREVDILAEGAVYGVIVRIAVEVRARTRKDDVQWIDAVVGKYRDLAVDKVIAVSATGFSDAARQKARGSGIHLMSATEADVHDWPTEFYRLGAATLRRRDHVDVSIRTDPPRRNDLGRDSRLSIADGTDVGSLGEFIEFIADRHRTRLDELLRAKFLEHYKSLADLDKVLVSEDVITPPVALWVQSNAGNRIQVLHAAVRATSTHEVVKVPVRHTAISGHLISSGELPKQDGSSVELFAIQRSDLPGRVGVRIAPKPSARAPRSGRLHNRPAPKAEPANSRMQPAARGKRKRRG